ncbi:uncharacterized protein METZ01_LOCUS25636 [marine metagenome]|uniref:Uncharacterized protein n=1 Tax=marine metagenome TaxID=408172 RepID=A0A381Q0E8_9ZZZZ
MTRKSADLASYKETDKNNEDDQRGKE